MPESPVFPAITYDLAGGSASAIDSQRDEPRVRISCWGPKGVAGMAQAYALALEVRDVMLPEEIRVQGFRGDVILSGGVAYVWNVVQEVGPTPAEDVSGYGRYDTLYRITHYFTPT